MRKMIWTVVVLCLLVLAVSCGAPEVTTETTTTESATTAPIQVTLPVVTEQLEMRQFDEDALYRHVFEEHSLKLEYEKMLTYVPNPDRGEVLIAFTFNTGYGELASGDLYLVEGITTAFHQAGSETYYVHSHIGSENGTFGSDYIRHDYHEAYLNVLFEHLTMSPCEALPTIEEGIHSVGDIVLMKNEGRPTYDIFSDGYLYRTVTDENGKDSYLKSDQKIDAAYLYGMIFVTYQNRAMEKSKGFSVNEGNAIQAPVRIYRETAEDAYAYYISRDGSVSQYAQYAIKADPCEKGHEKGSFIVIGEYCTLYSKYQRDSLYNQKPELFEDILPDDYVSTAK